MTLPKRFGIRLWPILAIFLLFLSVKLYLHLWKSSLSDLFEPRKPKFVFFDLGVNNGDSLLTFLQLKQTGNSLVLFIINANKLFLDMKL